MTSREEAIKQLIKEQLRKAAFTIEDLLESIETLYSIELVDLNRVSPSFRKEAMKTAEIIYE